MDYTITVKGSNKKDWKAIKASQYLKVVFQLTYIFCNVTVYISISSFWLSLFLWYGFQKLLNWYMWKKWHFLWTRCSNKSIECSCAKQTNWITNIHRSYPHLAGKKEKKRRRYVINTNVLKKSLQLLDDALFWI